MNTAQILSDVAVMLTAAAIAAVFCAKFKWPKVIGYLLVGILLGEHTWGGAYLANATSMTAVGTFGVVFLMFTMGLGFSPKALGKIRNVIVTTAVLDTFLMTWLGFTLARQVFGWGTIPSLFLGAAICDSATTMLAKVVGELKCEKQPFVRYALGTSVCEDILCVGLIALITGFAQGGVVSLSSVGMSLGGLFLFFLAVIVFGFVLVPRLLKSVNKLKDTEALLLTILASCIVVSAVAERFEFSLALGAFLIGVVGGASDVRKRIVSLCEPLSSTFASIFFVTIGLLVDPVSAFRHAPEILLLTAVVIGGKFVNCTVGALLSGLDVKTAVRIGMSLAQIGEFSFMVAILYVGLTGDSSSPMYQIVVTTSLLTTLLNPLMIRLSEPAGTWAERHLPSRLGRIQRTYAGFVAKLSAPETHVSFQKTVRTCAIQLAVIAALDLAVVIVCTLLANVDWSRFSVFFNTHKRFAFCLLGNLFIVGMFAPAWRIARTLGTTLADVLVAGEDSRWQHAARRLLVTFVQIAVAILFFCEMTMLNVNFAPDTDWERFTILGILVIAGIFGWNRFVKVGQRAFTRFNESLTAEERAAKMEKMMTVTIPEDTVHRLTLDMSSPAVGGTVVTLNIRAKTGATVTAVERGGAIFRNVGPDFEFLSGDTLIVLGDRTQVAQLKDLLGIVAESALEENPS